MSKEQHRCKFLYKHKKRKISVTNFLVHELLGEYGTHRNLKILYKSFLGQELNKCNTPKEEERERNSFLTTVSKSLKFRISQLLVQF